MREIFKKLDWGYWAIFTIALVVAYFITDIVKDAVTELPWWYTQAAEIGVVLVILAGLTTLRLVVLFIYTIVKNAMAAGRNLP